MSNFVEETITSKNIFEGRIIKLRVDDVHLPDGKVSTREIIELPGAVGILAITQEEKIILVRQYRKPMEKLMVELPAGMREKGEDPITTARRELEEETGYTCEKLKYIHSFYTAPGFSDELLYLYEAIGLEKMEQAPNPDEDEFIELLEVSLHEAMEMIQDEEIQDAKTIIAIQYLMMKKKACRN